VRKNLTEIGLQNLKPKSKPYEISDTKSALRVAVFPSGVHSFICRYRFAGRTRKYTLQSGLSLADARIAVADAMKLLQQGRDPADVKKAASASAAAADADTLQAVAELYLSRDGKKLRSIAEQRRCFAKHIFPVLGGKPIAKIVRSDIVKLLDKIVDEAGPFAADSARAYLSVRHFHLTHEPRCVTADHKGGAEAETIPDGPGVTRRVGCGREVQVSVRRHHPGAATDRRAQK
jgi:hypothetical protein